jgi:hypothetical protein
MGFRSRLTRRVRPTWGRRIQRFRQGFNKGFDLVPNTAVMAKGFLFGLGVFRQARRIVEPGVHNLRLAGENGARLVRVVADRHDIIKVVRRQFGDGLGPVAGDVYACLGHDLHRPRIQTMSFDASREGLDRVAFQCACPAFGHLAAAGIAGAEKQDF